jgi:broad specificity phosphatase PhoE
MKLYVLRHGETDYNAGNLVQGTTDIPLSEEGRRQALRARKRVEDLGLSFERVYSSPLQRALVTGELVTGRSRETFLADRRLREIEVGALAGRSTLEDTEIMRNFMCFPDRYVPLPGGESFPELVKRAGDFLEWIRKEDLPGSALVCTHGGWLHAMRMYLEPGPMRDFWKPPITNCTMFLLETDREGRWKITDIIENTEGRALGF